MSHHGRFSPKLVAGIILALFFGVALCLRIALPYDQVFGGDWIKFTGVDAYYHMRIVDNLVHNFPHHSLFNPYMIYPGGGEVTSLLFFDYLLGGIIWLIGLGAPTQHTIDIVGVYFPAVLGALTVIPVYFIGKALFNRWAGVIAAGLIALLPGEFLGRSILGFTDHHVAEVLFTTVTMLFLILALKSARQKQLTFNHLKHREWAVITKPLICSLLAGIFLGIYLLSWHGALMFVFIVFVYFIIQFIIDHLKHISTDYLCLVSTVTFFIALIMFLPVSQAKLYLASLIIALLAPALLSIISRLMTRREVKPAYYPLTLIALGLASLAIFHVVNPSLLGTMVAQFSIFTPARASLTVLEVQPILFPGGDFSLSVAWGSFTTSFFLGFISLGILIYFTIKRGEADKTLFLVWSLMVLAATLGQRRFAYYFAVNVALLAGYFSWLILQFAGFKELIAEPVETPRIVKKKKAKVKKRRKGGFRITTSHIYMAFGVIFIVYLLAFFPKWDNCTVRMSIATASQAQFAPSNAWCESLSWLKDNTADPFGDPDFYYQLHETPFHYPDTAYGVTAWWDYGYWIARIGHRIPNSNPAQAGAGIVAKLFITQDEDSASGITNKLNSKYVVIDHATATVKFHALPAWAARSEEEFYDVYYLPQNSKLAPVLLFYPEYYRSLVIRLYNFDGSEVIPQSSTVISYKERISREGEPYKEITSSQSFPSYEEAEAYVLSQESDNYRIVSNNPFISPVPLEALEHYKLIHSSETSMMQPGVGMISEVKIFEYTE